MRRGHQLAKKRDSWKLHWLAGGSCALYFTFQVSSALFEIQEIGPMQLFFEQNNVLE
jgi:hypothetical protein